MKYIIGRNSLFLSFISALLLAVSSAQAADSAKPFLHPLFADHMVLQRGMADPIWGWTDPGATVTVRVNGKTYTATADANGKWLAKIGPFKAGGCERIRPIISAARCPSLVILARVPRTSSRLG